MRSRMVDFFARRTNYLDHMAPIWHALDEDLRGSFYVPQMLEAYASRKGIEATALRAPGINNILDVVPPGKGPLLTAAYGDLQQALHGQKRQHIFMEHGVGLTFPHNAYAGGAGAKRDVALFLDPNEHVRRMNARTWPHKRGEVIGTPKMDEWAPPHPDPLPAPGERRSASRGEGAVVCISFHWEGEAIAPEAGNAFKHYKQILPELASSEKFTLIGHCHPRAMGVQPFYEQYGIEIVNDFEEVLRRADLYVNDCSSTLYEFCVTGKPVIILNAPQFRRNVHLGIRFWEYTDVGPMVNEPEELVGAIEEMLTPAPAANPAGVPDARWKLARARAVRELYPYLGESAKRAAGILGEFAASKGAAPVKLTEVRGESIGILYMGFGEAAAREIRKSMASLRNTGLKIPVCVVGDTPVRGAQFIEWTGQSPFDPDERQNFQFRAGRIKPHLAGMTPFERTLYIDADTEFMADITKGFEMLDECDIALAEETLAIGDLYNKPRAGWEINILERDATIEELGGDRTTKFLNSGVIFFRKSEKVRALFEEWSRQWLRWQQWDEQLALMRAMHAEPGLKVRRLSVDWNHPHRNRAKIIFHNYGRGVARSNVTPATPPHPDPLPVGEGAKKAA